jgi:phage gpG-like protein
LLYTLRAARGEIEQPDKMLDSIGEMLLRANRKRHKANLAPDGSPWKTLSPLTIGAKVWKKQKESFRKNKSMSLATVRRVRAGGILRDTGDMLSSLTYQVNGDELRLWFDGSRESKLAGFHQFGTAPHLITPRQRQALAFAGIVTKRVNHPGLPKRELIGFPDADRDLVETIATDHLTRVLKRARAK